MAGYRDGGGDRPRRNPSRDRRGANDRGRARKPGAPQDFLHADLASMSVSRRALVKGAFGVCGVFTLARLASYQIVDAGTYMKEADARRLSAQTLYAKRGTIYDRNGNVLAASQECYNVFVNPSLITKKTRKKAIRALVDGLGMEEGDVEDIVDRDGTFAYVKRQVDADDAEALMKKGIKGIDLEPTIKRVYPYGSLASQILGIVNIDNEGVSGLEKYYDEVLTGKNGSLVRERGADGSFIAGGAYKKVPATDGMDIVLTLDANIQRAAEEATAEGVENSGAKYGSSIVCDPTTGEILAACSSPTYDPTDLANASNEDMNLRAVTDAYEPGSVFKTFVAAAALETGKIKTSTVFNVPPQVKAGDDTVTDVDGRSANMSMDIREILRRSSNTGMVLVGQKLGADAFAKDVIDAFGFGKKTGIDFPGEITGLVKSRDEYDGGSLGAMSFGQSIAVPPVEMVHAMSALANKGVMTTPHFLKTRAGDEVDWTDGETRAVSEETASTLAELMKNVVDAGTGSGAQIAGYHISGKTGTAQRAVEGRLGYVEGHNMASFMGFVSTEDPRVMCYVTLDGTPQQSYAATPVFKKIMETALPALGIEPQE